MLGPREQLYRLALRLNRPLLEATQAFDRGDFVHTAGAIDPLSGVVPERTTLSVAITTHARPAACDALLGQLAEQLARCAGEHTVAVFEDPSAHPYDAVRARLAQHWPERSVLYTASRRLGKQGYARAFGAVFAAAKRLRPALTLSLQDDVRLADDAIPKALALWDAIRDSNKGALYLFAGPDDEPHGRWVRFERRRAPGAPASLTQWLDLQGFLAGPRFFEALHHRMFAVPAERWQRDPTLSSGVGEQLTRRLFGRANLYQVHEPLVLHGKLPSLMNPEARAVRTLSNFSD